MHGFRRLVGVPLLLTALGGTQLFAADKDAAQPPDPCAGASTDIANTNCREDQATAAETRLDALYRTIEKAIRAKADADPVLRGYRERTLEKLKAAELAWRRYRDAQCAAAEQQNEGGTIAPSIHAGCVKDLADRRAEELKKTYAIYLLPP